MTMVAERPSTISVTKLHPAIAAEIRGVDLSRPVDDETMRRDQGGLVQQHRAGVPRSKSVARTISAGSHPTSARLPSGCHRRPGAKGAETSAAWDDMMMVTDNVDADGKPVGSLGHGEMWFHTDKCYHRRPHRASFLYGIEIPAEGGHTKFSSLYAAYENLPAELKRQLEGVMVIQGQQYGVGRRIDLTLKLESTHHCAQPIVVTNPDSGRKGLYVASQNSMWIEGMDRDESEALLQKLFDYAEDPAIIYEHVWRVGDLVMWDNLSCLHARTDWPSEQRRTLRRCTVEGEPLY